MTPFSRENAILIYLPKVGQISQNQAKSGQIYNLRFISQKLSDNFSYIWAKAMLIMTPISSQNTILIELSKFGQICNLY